MKEEAKPQVDEREEGGGVGEGSLSSLHFQVGQIRWWVGRTDRGGSLCFATATLRHPRAAARPDRAQRMFFGGKQNAQKIGILNVEVASISSKAISIFHGLSNADEEDPRSF